MKRETAIKLIDAIDAFRAYAGTEVGYAARIGRRVDSKDVEVKRTVGSAPRRAAEELMTASDVHVTEAPRLVARWGADRNEDWEVLVNLDVIQAGPKDQPMGEERALTVLSEIKELVERAREYRRAQRRLRKGGGTEAQFQAAVAVVYGLR